MAGNLTGNLAGKPPEIQPQGWLIVCDGRAAGVLRHSANLGGLFPAWSGTFIGANLREILGLEVTHGLRNALSRFSAPAPPALLTGLLLPGCEGAYDVTVQLSDEETLIEIEKAAPESDRPQLDRLRAFLARLAQAGDLDKTLQTAARMIFSMLNYDRVAVLRVDARGQANFLAEQRVADLKPWSEVADPKEIFSEETRANIQASRLRLIVDAASPPAAVLSGAESGPLNLSLAFLRAASADEHALLRRIGSVSALTFALVVEDRLWGLVFCAHRTPRHPPMDLRAAAELFTEFLALRLQILSQRLAARDHAARPETKLEGLRVMIVEDQALIAMDLEALLNDKGIGVASVCSSSAQALSALESIKFDVAILDLHLAGETSLIVAEALEQREIPFIFATGDGEDRKMPTRLAGRTITRKPYDLEQILAALREVMASRD